MQKSEKSAKTQIKVIRVLHAGLQGCNGKLARPHYPPPLSPSPTYLPPSVDRPEARTPPSPSPSHEASPPRIVSATLAFLPPFYYFLSRFSAFSLPINPLPLTPAQFDTYPERRPVAAPHGSGVELKPTFIPVGKLIQQHVT